MSNNKNTIKEQGYMSSFKVPDGYFEDFASKMDELLDQTENSNVKIADKFTGGFKNRMLTLRPIFYMAAMFVVLLFSITAILKYTTKDKQTTGLATNGSTDSKQVLTAEDYLLNSIGTYTITEYYIDPEIFEE